MWYDISTYQFSQPLRDLVWLRRGGPPPGPAILAAEIKIKVVVARKYENAARKRGRAEYGKASEWVFGVDRIYADLLP